MSHVHCFHPNDSVPWRSFAGHAMGSAIPEHSKKCCHCGDVQSRPGDIEEKTHGGVFGETGGGREQA